MKKLLCIVLCVSVIAACNSLGDKYEVNEKSDIFYKDGMTSGDAKLLGDFLVRNGYFDSVTEKSVQLFRHNDSVTVKFMDDKARLDSTTTEALYVIMGTSISTEVFGARPLRLELADHNMKTFRIIPVPGTLTDSPANK